MNKRGVTVWFTGLSSSGKTTISKAVAGALRSHGHKVQVLDENLVQKNQRFASTKLEESILKIAFVSHLLTLNEVIVLVSTISPDRQIREKIRQRIGNFVEVYVNAPLLVCEERDTRGLYQLARSGKINSFAGINHPYEPPLNPEVECRSDREEPSESAVKVLQKLDEFGYLDDNLMLKTA